MAALSLSELNALRQSAVVILAQQSAMRAVRRRIQKEGRIKGPLPLSTLSRLANEWLHDHPQLLAEAAASPIVAELIKREGQLS
jgi:phage FluMu protein gp41